MIPIMGISIPVPSVFKCAATEGHPFQAACADFIREHGLALKPVGGEVVGRLSFVVIRTEGDKE